MIFCYLDFIYFIYLIYGTLFTAPNSCGTRAAESSKSGQIVYIYTIWAFFGPPANSRGTRAALARHIP